MIISLTAYPQSSPNIFVSLNPVDSISTAIFLKNNNPTPLEPGERENADYILGDIHPHINNNHTVNTNKSVGQINYQMTTNLFGALTVNVPIEVYPDPKGLSPEIAIHYNSMGTNGSLGVGWKLTGVSTITRSHKNFHFDNKIEALIAGDKNSVFLLDGMRLIKTDETDNQLNFISEQGNIKVIGYLAGNNIRYFKAYFPDGQQTIYGFMNSTSGETLTYPITKMSDIGENSISYEYESVGGHHRIKKIIYGKTNQISVEFNYSPGRTDELKAYNAGIEINYNYKLNSIVTKYGNNILRTYTINYVNKGYITTIDKIECSTNNKSYNPLIFHYGDNNQVKEFRNDPIEMKYRCYYEKPGEIRATKGKFEYGTDNDGLIMVRNKIHYLHYYRKPVEIFGIGFSHSTNQIRNGYDNEVDTIFISSRLSDYQNQQWMLMPTAKDEGFIDIFSMDLDDSYGEEIIKINNTNNGNQETLKFKVYSYGVLGNPFREKYTRTYTFNTNIKDQGDRYSLHPKYYFTGNFTGDGKNYILAVATHKPMGMNADCKYYLFDLENDNIITQDVSPFQYNVVYPKGGEASLSGEEAYNQSDKFFTFDFNGDGKTDICHINDRGTYIYTLEKNGSDYEFVLLANYTGLKREDLIDKDLLLGEFNGDGLLDFLISPLKDSGNVWRIVSSTGGNNPAFVESQINLAVKTEKARFVMHDMNSDGMSDLIEVSGEGDDSKLTTYFISNGVYKEKYSCPFPENTVVIPTNIRSNNYFNNIVSIKNEWVNKISFKNNETKSVQLTGLTDSYGVISKISYLQLNENPYYSMNFDAVFPYANFQGGFSTVFQIQSYLKSEKIKDIHYMYRNAVTHKQGLGFCGFSEIRSSNSVANEYKNEKYDPYNFSVIKEVETLNTKESFAYSIKVASNKLKTVGLSRRTEQDKLTGAVSTFSYSYDKFGNPLNETVIFGDGMSSSTITNKYHNIDTDDKYIIGLLKERGEVKTRNNLTINNKTTYTYYNNYLLSSINSFFNNKKISEEAYFYDNDLNLTESKSRAYNSNNWLTTGFTYDTEGRIKKETDPLGLYVESFYDSKGRLSSTTNYKGHTTSYEYDDWGKIIKVTYPDGMIKENLVSWATTPTNALYVLTEKASGQAESKVFFDALGREVKKGAKRYNGSYLYTDFVFNEKGRVEKTSLPFKTTPTHWNEYSYDYFNRLTSIAYSSGRVDSYSYNNMSVTSVIDGITTTKTHDATGLVVKVKDPAGSITYNYRPDGQLSSVVAPGKITTRFVYDEYGRQIQIDDPSAGIKVIEYDAAGNIHKETDARGKTSIYLYDNFNRLIQANLDNELNTTYSYNEDGLIQSITSDNGSSLWYDYNDLLQLETEKETVADNKYLQKIYSYNDYGNVSSIKYANQSGQIATENHIYNYGHLSEIKLDNAVTIWKITSENDMGIPTGVQTGILARNYSYDSFGLPTGRTVKKGNDFVQNFTYSFDAATNNLTYRVDNKRNIREDFQYDNLNRLTHFGNSIISYNSKGNIIKNSDIGRYEYDPAKPYAVQALNLYDENIPTRTQDITYNAMLRPASISENGYVALLDYTADGERMKMTLSKDSVNILTRYYIGGQYELDLKDNGSKEKLYLGGTSYSASAVLVRESGSTWKVHYLCRDYLGSITHITDDQGNLVEELSYTAWGRLRSPDTQVEYKIDEEPTMFLDRGYTGHEHLLMFGFINMNARLYDPVLGSFISPDPFIQAPLMTQNFNRYSYAMNNPLRFTDASGEFIIPLLIVVGVAAVTGYVTYGIVTGNWGMNAITAGLTSAAFAALGYWTMGGTMTVSSAWWFAGKDAANSILSNFIQPLSGSLGNFGISISPIAMLTSGIGSAAGLGSGFRFGTGISVSQKIGDWTIIAGGSFLDGKGFSGYGGFSYDDGTRGFSYVANYYGYNNNTESGSHKQVTGTAGFRAGDFSIKHENDLLGTPFNGFKNEDRFRTAAVEVGYRDLVTGFNIYTTDPSKNADGEKMTIKINGQDFYTDGNQLASPFYVGIKKNGATIKVGSNYHGVGIFQNALHKYITKDPQFHYRSPSTNQHYFEMGYNWNPYSLYTY